VACINPPTARDVENVKYGDRRSGFYMHHQQSYHLLSSVISQEDHEPRRLFAWSVKSAVRGLLSHETYLRQAKQTMQARKYLASASHIEKQLALLADLDSNAISDLMQTATGFDSFVTRWNAYNQIAPLGVNTRVSAVSESRLPAENFSLHRHINAQEADTRQFRHDIMVACIRHLQPDCGRPRRPARARRVMGNLEKLGVKDAALHDLCHYLYGCPAASLDLSAAKLAFSSRSLQRHLMLSGLSYVNLRMAIRLDIAAEAIHENAASLTGIAHHAGFFDSAHMDRVWKMATGINPSQYRQLLT
jgi:AraC-like DNA-binding protein